MSKAGRLNKLVTFQREHREPDGAGGYALAWIPVAEVWGGLRLARGDERSTHDTLEGTVAGTLTVRASELTNTISSKDRVLIPGFDGTDDVYAIVSPPMNRDQRSRFLEFEVRRGAST